MKRLLLFLLVTITAQAQYSQRQATVFTSQGRPANQATVRVCAFSDTTCAAAVTIYSSSTGASQTNPFQTDTVGNYSFYAPTGYYTVKETYQGTSYTYKILLSNPSHNFIYADQYPQATSALKIVQACIDAGSNGTVIVPPGMSAGMPTAWTSGCTVWDYRGGAVAMYDSDGTYVYGTFNLSRALAPDTHGYAEIYSIIRPVAQTAGGSQPPLGHDLGLHARGAADIRVRNEDLTIVSSTNVVAPGTVTVTVGSTASLFTAAPLTIDRYKGSEETIAMANWSIVDSTHIQATFAKTHTAPFDVLQRGTLLLDTAILTLRQSDFSTTYFQVSETSDSAAANRGFTMYGPSSQKIIAMSNTSANYVSYFGHGNILNLYASDGATATGGTIFLKNNTADDFAALAVSTTAGTTTLGSTSALHPRLYLDDTNFAGGKKFQIHNGGGGAGVLTFREDTSGFNFLTYTSSSRVLNVGSGDKFSIGGGTAITKYVEGTVVQDLASISANTCADTNGITVTGAVDGDVAVGSALAAIASTAGLQISAYVSAADTAKVRVCNVTVGAIDPASTTYRVGVWVH